MSEETFCGIVLSGSKDEPCSIAFLSEELETFSETDDERILELISERRPSVVAFTVPPVGADVDEGFREDEQEMVEEGHSFLPPEMRDNDEMERALFLKNSLQREGFLHDVIECRPMITAEILDIEGDDDLEELGVPTGEIMSMKEFEAVLAAVTAKFYANDSFEEKDFIVPKPLDE
ncbi:MAG: hypothetical protein SV186_00570 [Candidatus Nanohaloarchaea archaeon]|nr:hypothetical protein [Candidatus Nanohaloarchaea archaeon]